jgi:RNA polymerase sigma-70 factor, ECF subfamily
LTEQLDSKVIARFMDGDEDAFREVINHYKNGLYAFLKRFLNHHDQVEDVFQETFLQLYNSRSSFDPTKNLRPWLFTIAANKAKDALRKQQRTAAIPIGSITGPEEISFGDALDIITSHDKMPLDELAQDETAMLVRQIISEMPENLREILILSYFNQFSYKQMAQMLSIPIGTIKSRLHTAVAKFAKEWKSAVGSSKK